MGMLDWTEKSSAVLRQGGVIGPDERLPWPQTALMGVQHVIAMFGSTVLAPLLMGFDPNIAILMSGIGTLIFFAVTGGKVPSYLGSSFAFIGVVIAATGYAGKGPNANIGVALGGIIACGAVYAAIGALVQAVGTRWIERFMPPVVTGAVVAVIGLNLASIPVKNMAASNFDAWMQVVTFVSVALVAVLARGMLQRLLILIGLIASSLVYALLTNGLGLGKPIDLSGMAKADWFGMPGFTAPVFSTSAMLLIVPVVIILVAENLGHIKAVTAMTGKNLDRYMGRAFIGDGVATMVSGSLGGTGVTTYAENIGVMAATRIYSTAVFVFAALIAVAAGLQPQVRRADPGDSAAGDGRREHRGVRPDRGGGREDLGRQPGGFFGQQEPAGGGHHAGAGHRRLHAEVRPVCAGRHWHRDLWRHLAACAARPQEINRLKRMRRPVRRLLSRRTTGPARRPAHCSARSSAPGPARPGSRPAGAPGRRAPGFPLSAPG